MNSLRLLNRELIEMGALCEEVIALAAQALTEGNAELAARVAPNSIRRSTARSARSSRCA